MNTSPMPRRPGVTTPSPAVEPPPAAAPARRRASTAARRPAAALGASLLIAASLAGGPMAAASSAQSQGSVLGQSAGSAAPSSSPMAVQSKGSKGAAPGTEELKSDPDFTAPGIEKGQDLIGWAKAGALIIGTLTLIIGIPMSKALKEAGNHHASGVRAGAMGVGGAILLAGVAGSALPWLMNV